jgi:hypothetical protein
MVLSSFKRKGIYLALFSILLLNISCQTNTLLTISGGCLDVTPQSTTDCTSIRPTDSLCCYTQVVYGSQKPMCSLIPKSAYTGQKGINIDGTEYTMTCNQNDVVGLTKDSVLETCGPKDPKSQSDCSTGSSFTSSCCYFEGNTATTNTAARPAACYNLGTKFKGTASWAQMTINCRSEVLTFSSFVLLILAFLFF